MGNKRGFTLVELMIVLAIIAVLAALGTLAYGQYIKSAKVQKLESYANELQSGQERYRSRNNFYWNGGSYSGTNIDKFKNLLDFTRQVPPGVEITVEAWDGTGPTCNICAGAPFSNSSAGYAIRVRQDLTPGGKMTTIVVTNDTQNPILMNEGD